MHPVLRPTSSSVARLAWLLALVALLLVGCPDAATPTDGAHERVADAALDLSDVFVSTDGSIDATHDTLPVDAADVVDVAVDAELPDDVPHCTPGMTMPCTCYQTVPGTQTCHRTGRWGYCTCQLEGGPDAGTLPPRLIAPLSGSRVMSQRPTLRWVLPVPLTRARVELCGDRACTRMIRSTEVAGTSWRSESVLSPGVAFWRVRGLATDGSVAWTSATWSFAVRHRDTPVDTANVPLHDFNGDGFDDAVVFAEGGSGVLPEMRVFWGAVEGIRETPTILRNSTDLGEGFDPTVTIGDFDGNGFADIAVSDNATISESERSPSVQGHVFVFSGDPEGVSPVRLTTMTMRAEPAFPSDAFAIYGRKLGAVDFNGDGYDDLVVFRMISGASNRFPQVFLYPGSETGLQFDAGITLPIQSDLHVQFFGFWGLGDVNGDGYGDLALSIDGHGGGYEPLQILYGNPSARLGTRIEEIEYPHVTFFAESGARGDFNGDGFADVFTGGIGHVLIYWGSDEGVERLLRLPPAPLGYDMIAPFGRFLWNQGDLNGDGLYDVAAGGVCDAENKELHMVDRFCAWGRVLLYASTSAGVPSMPTHRLVNPYENYDPFGYPQGELFWKAGSPGDLDGDGADDLIVGTYGSFSEITRGGGAIHVYFGGLWEWTRPSISIWGDRAHLGMGQGIF